MIPNKDSRYLKAGAVVFALLLFLAAVGPLMGPIFVKRINNIRYADQYSGADAVAQITAAIADSPTGGTVIANYSAAQSSSSTLTIAKSVTLDLRNLITLPSVVVSASNVTILCPNGYAGNGFAQSTTGSSWLQATSVSGLKIEGCSFTGITGSTFTFSNNNAIRLIGVSGAKLINNSFTGWQGDAIQVLNSSDVDAGGNVASSINGSAVRFMGVNRGKIQRNTARATALPIGTATIGIIVDSISGTGYSNSTGIDILGNIVQGYPNYQAITLHDCQHCAVVGNTMTDVSTGVAVVRSSASDLNDDIAIVGNNYAGTTTTGQCGGCTNIGINLTGADATNIVRRIVVVGNVIKGANAAMLNTAWGGIVTSFADDVTISGNELTNDYGTCITLSTSATRQHVTGNSCTDVQTVSGARIGVFANAGTATGSIEGNRFDTMDYGIRADQATLGMAVGINQYNTVTERIHNPGNFNLAQITDGTFEVDNNVSNSYYRLFSSNGVQTSNARMTAVVTNGNTGEVQFGITDASPYGWKFVGTNVPVFIAGTAPTDSLRVETTGAVSFNGGAQIANSTKLPQVGTPTVGQAACIKAAGPPVLIGFCSTTPTSGTCTCN